MAEVETSELDKARFTQWLINLAAQFQCTVEIDWEKHLLWFEGPEEMQTAIAIEMGKHLKGW